jgi:hypothetical protein
VRGGHFILIGVAAGVLKDGVGGCPGKSFMVA